MATACAARRTTVRRFPTRTQADDDGDGIGDVCDNCIDEANPNQCDFNEDGYGNLCDCDFSDTGGCGNSDFIIMSQAWGKVYPDPFYHEQADMTADGGVGNPDFIQLSKFWGEEIEGKSGLDCAGLIPGACPPVVGTCTSPACIGDPQEVDPDGDGVCGAADNCPTVPNTDQADDDGVGDVCDNCISEPNADQCDFNEDGYGNLCDCDFSDTGGCGNPDFIIMTQAWGRVYPDPFYHEQADMTADGGVGNPDYIQFIKFWGEEIEGKSGLACAGLVDGACPPVVGTCTSPPIP